MNIWIEPVNVGVISALSKIPGVLERAMPRAVRRTLRSGRQAAGRKIAERYTISARAVTSTIQTRVSGLSGEMTSKGRRNPLERFKINPKRRQNPGPAGGVQAVVVKGQGGKIRRAFLQRNGGVYERTGRSRFPIRRFSGPSAPGMLGNSIVAPFIIQHMQKRLDIELVREASAVLGGFA